MESLSSYHDKEGITNWHSDETPGPMILRPPTSGFIANPDGRGYGYHPLRLFWYFRDQLAYTSENRAELLSQLSLADNVTDMMNNVALSMSSALMNNVEDFGENVIGTGYRDEVFIHVKWPWLILTATLVLSTMILLLVVMIESSRDGIVLWKSSILALMFHGHGLHDENAIPVHQVSQMETMAKGIKAEMLGQHEDWKFVRR